MFQLRHVQFKDILHIENFSIPGQRVCCLFGESGSGKSTLLKMLNGMLTQDSGEVLYKNQEISSYDPVDLRKEVVMLGQDAVMFEGTVRDNLLIGRKFSGKEETSDQKLGELLNALRLGKQLEDEADKLSGGEKQRVAFGRVLLMDAEVYLLDEPTSALDVETETLVMDLFTNQLRERDKTAVFVTHSKEVAEKYADEIFYMNDILVSEGT
ncbi:putative ABC transport system ATP-binding protein [Gracilibacillus ureilyticus]|uniref:Putative ABC transport system ATP-binding protein n=1 Tax=Gracilibacillus ureilyticus TaxID=531814 RepID=A0A1H9RSJ5_9BACI|nr:ABC transporter ATP-binding protein [Gracilibacillus ureilyticus]SER74889.1 putative ABC transport system ATP-binding protein [Gracilibacillus ureilyticus]